MKYRAVQGLGSFYVIKLVRSLTVWPGGLLRIGRFTASKQARLSQKKVRTRLLLQQISRRRGRTKSALGRRYEFGDSFSHLLLGSVARLLGPGLRIGDLRFSPASHEIVRDDHFLDHI